jgi:6-phosphogluconolactonase/glucosamine-6-phosphate isomerase/deaminase
VDERVAPAGDPDRNLTLQLRALPAGATPTLRPMPVEQEDLERAADRYAAAIASSFDVVHLGLGPDGHTASLVPGDPILETHDRTVGVTDPYQGRRRMTLTYPGLARATRAVWFVTGAEKRDAVRRLLARDPSIPATGVTVADQVLVVDAAAMPRDERGRSVRLRGRVVESG